MSNVWCLVEVNHGGSTRWAQIGTTEALKACPALCVSTNPPVCYTSSNKWQPLTSPISCLLCVPDGTVIFRGQWLFSEICRTGSSVSLVLTHYHITSRLNHHLQWMQNVFVLVCIILNNNKFLSWSFLNFFQHSQPDKYSQSWTGVILCKHISQRREFKLCRFVQNQTKQSISCGFECTLWVEIGSVGWSSYMVTCQATFNRFGFQYWVKLGMTQAVIRVPLEFAELPFCTIT